MARPPLLFGCVYYKRAEARCKVQVLRIFAGHGSAEKENPAV